MGSNSTKSKNATSTASQFYLSNGGWRSIIKKKPIYVALLKTWSRLPVLLSFVLFQAAAFPQKKSLEYSG